jgi:hypothetical protein
MGLRRCLVAVLSCALLLLSRPARAYSVLAHEAVVDAVWDGPIATLLRARFPQLSQEGLTQARAFAYGGSVIQDLGYYPFGSHLFTNLVHYVRSGDFVEALIRDAHDANEYAFALGALAHFFADSIGHPTAVNRAVPLVYPKMRVKYGDEVTYAESPKRHIMIEFAFDVVQVAAGAYLPQAHHDFVGFQVATPALERAFRETYGLEVKDLFLNVDLAIGTYRYAVGRTIPEVTRVAWRDKREKIEKLTPGVTQETFVYSMTRQQYEQQFGVDYRKPGTLARVLAFLFKLIPKVGPFRPLAFKAPTPEAEQLFLDSFSRTRDRYRELVVALRDRPPDLANTDIDTGKPAVHGEYALADETYAELLDKLASRGFAEVPNELRRNINAFYATGDDSRAQSRKERKREAKARQHLAAMNGAR